MQLPLFKHPAADVQILDEPSEFYQEILERIDTAQRRITLSSLYLGNGPLEAKIVQALDDAMKRNPNLQVHILLDYLRGTRPPKSSIDLLRFLLHEHPRQFRLSLWHTPDLSGWKRKLPPRWNEIVGVQHVKAYIFDDDLLLSGANLSQIYFEQRQDRYVWIKNGGELVNYFTEFIDVLGKLSFECKSSLSSNNSSTTVPVTIFIPPVDAHPVHHSRKFKEKAYNRISEFLDKWSNKNGMQLSELLKQDWTAKDDSSEDAWILPTVQLGSIAIRQDEQAIIELLKHLTSGKTEPTKLFITSGYFNFTPAYSSLITNSKAPCEILTASPEANGFFNGKGISGKVPEAYSWILLDFLKRLPHSEPPQLPPSTSSQNASSPTSPLIQVREYKRDGWTYHAKGLWATHGNLSSPFMTTIGSPNFGFRSVQRDVEAQVLLFTRSPSLQQQMGRGIGQLMKYSSPPMLPQDVFPKNGMKPSRWVRYIIRYIQTML